MANNVICTYRASHSTLTTQNPLLQNGQEVIVTGLFTGAADARKVGNGTDRYNDLPFVNDIIFDSLVSGARVVKWANGRMVVTIQQDVAATLNTVFGGVFRSGAFPVAAFQDTFTSVPWVSFGVFNADGVGCWVSPTGVPTTTQAPTYIIVTGAADGTNRTYSVNTRAEGRWN